MPHTHHHQVINLYICVKNHKKNDSSGNYFYLQYFYRWTNKLIVFINNVDSEEVGKKKTFRHESDKKKKKIEHTE